MPPFEKRAEPLIIDPRGAPLRQAEPLVTRRASRVEKIIPSSGGGIVIPDVRTTLPKELKGKEFHSKDGLLYLPSEKDDQKVVETDITSAPKELREEQPVEYFGFKASEVMAVQDTHRRYAKNLYSGLPEQKAIYLCRLMEAAGFPTEQAEDDGAVAFVHGMARVIARESREKDGEKPSFVREGFLGKFCADFGQPRHPTTSSEAGSYRNLALLLMPDIWNDLKPNERRWVMDSLLSLYEYTENAEDIYSPEVFLRAAEIVDTEEDAGVRSLIYLLCEMVPYGQIPEEAKDSLAKTIARRKEYHAPIATALLTDPVARAKEATGRGTLRNEYAAFRKDVLDRLSGDIDELARLPLAEWVKLVQDIERLNLLTVTDDPEEQAQLGKETFGIELEFAPYPAQFLDTESFAYDRESLLSYTSDRVSHIREGLKRLNAVKPYRPEGLNDCSIDHGCVEVRTTGASHLTEQTFKELRETVRAAEHFLPADVATFHLHVEREKKTHGFEQLFALERDNDNGPRGTLELRSFRPPTTLLQVPGGTKTRSQKTDIVAIERTVLFSTLSEDMPFFAYGDTTPPLLYDLDGFPAREGVRKILSLALCGQDPRQRAAAIQLMHRPPLFLHAYLMSERIFRDAPTGRKIEYCLEGRKMVYAKHQEDYTATWGSIVLDKPETYSLERGHLSPDDRKDLYKKLLQNATFYKAELEGVLRTHVSDASEEDRAQLHLMYHISSDAADIRAAFAYAQTHTPTDEAARRFLRLERRVLDELPDRDPELLKTLLIERSIPESLLNNVWYSIFGRIQHSGWQDFILAHYPELDARSREDIYSYIKREVTNDEYGRPVSPLLQDLFQKCVMQEQDTGIKMRAIALALNSGFLEDAFSAWKDILQGEFDKLDTKDCERLLETLVTTKDPLALEFLGEFFPYRIAWSEGYTKKLIWLIAENLGLEGRGFLSALYEHNPTPVVESAIEQALPFIRQQEVRPPRRRKASVYDFSNQL